MARSIKVRLHEAVLLSKQTPHRSAQELHAKIFPTLMRYGTDWYEYQKEKGAYHHLEDEEVDAECQAFLEHAAIRGNDEMEVEGDDGETEVADKKKRSWFNPKANNVSEVYKAVARQRYTSPERLVPPAFLPGIEPEFDGVDPNNLISCRNVLVDFVTRQTYHPTDQFFTMTGLPMDYDPLATCPQWLAFLHQVFQGNEVLIRKCRQMFGYIVSGQTKRQKVFFLKGKSRSGKGTMLRILSMLMGGKINVASPTIQDLCGSFGRENLVDKKVLIIPELDHANQQAMNNAATIILAISGQDDLDINRKHKKQLSAIRLMLNIVVAGNNSPNFREHTTAMGNRLEVFPFELTFAGREDFDLTDKLAAELPGILVWAMEGLADLQETGNFVTCPESERAKTEVLNSGDPTRGFVAERCELDPEATISVDILFKEMVSYCHDNEHRPPFKDKWCGALTTHFPTVGHRRLGSDGNRSQVFAGIRLRDYDPAYLMLPIRVDRQLTAIGFSPMEAIRETGLVLWSASAAEAEEDFGP